MSLRLDGVRLRLKRADECLALLDRERTALLNAKGNRVVGDFDADAGDYVFRVPGEGPPLAWGITISEYIHALRSTLDNLLWQLVITRGKMSPGRHTQFPIFEYEADRKGKPNLPKIRVMTRGVLDDDRTFIEDSQPYKAGWNLAKWHPLCLLGGLDDVDKHRDIHAAFAAAAQVPMGGPRAGRWFFQSCFAEASERMGLMTFPLDPALWERTGDKEHTLRFNIAGFASPVIPTDGSVVSDTKFATTFSFDGSYNDPTEVCRVFGVRAARADAKVEMQPGFLLDVSFSERERPLNIFDLREIRTAVQQVVDRFAPEIE